MSAGDAGARRRPATRVGRGCDARALVFKVRPKHRLLAPDGPGTLDSLGMLDALAAPPSATQGLLAVSRYVEAHKAAGAFVIPLCPDHPHEGPLTSFEKLSLAADEAGARALDRTHYVRVRNSADRRRLQRLLGEDPAVEYVHAPAVWRALPISASTTKAAVDATAAGVAATVAATSAAAAGADDDAQWGLHRCGFQEDVWAALDTAPTAGGRVGDDEIGVIDEGVLGLGHEELATRIANEEAKDGPGPAILHAAAVSAVIAARRGEKSGVGATFDMDGCCSARLRMYNILDADGNASYPALCAALHDAAKRRLLVVNMSIGGRDTDPTLNAAVADCVARDVVLVAATGDSGAKGVPLYPAALDGVVAVAGVDSKGRRIPTSSTGKHVFIAAPGERIWTIQGDESSAYAELSGSSFAAPFVSAAVWLARRYGQLDGTEVRHLLSRSVADKPAPTGTRDEEIGFGVLDMRKLRDTLLGAKPPGG